jgi:hypothetical protein
MDDRPVHPQASAHPSQRPMPPGHAFSSRADRNTLDTSVLVGKSTLVRDWAESLHRDLLGPVRTASTNPQAI